MFPAQLTACDGLEDGQTCTFPGSSGLYQCQNDVCLAIGVCGDGVRDEGEECDCGESHTSWPVECEGPNSDTEPDACRTDCLLAYCGDLVVDDGEACDDGNDTPADGCSADCQIDGCGDGVRNYWEDCDRGDLNNTTCLDLGYYAGELDCQENCRYDTSGCLTYDREGDLGACVMLSQAWMSACAADPEVIDFGTVSYGDTAAREVAIFNESANATPLIISGAFVSQFTGFGDLFGLDLSLFVPDPTDAQAYIEQPVPDLMSEPLVLRIDQSTGRSDVLLVQVSFLAETSGSGIVPQEYLVIASSDATESRHEIGMVGSVVGCPPGRADLDPGIPGCEYSCPVWPATTELCNNIDDDCDGVADNGIDLTSDPQHCGFCGHACDLPHAQSDCQNSLCVITSCDSTATTAYANINGDPADGCEYACPVWPATVEACDNMDNDCDGDVDEDFNLQNDSFNCGFCGNDCAAQGLTCAAGTCVLVCPLGTTLCSGSCVDTDTDPQHCNGCGNLCTNDHGTASCLSGTCAPDCTGLWDDCDGNPDNGCETAINTLTNCGGCGTGCALANATESCATGSCLITACSAGYCDEDAIHSTGCERDLDADPSCPGSAIDIGSVNGDSGSTSTSYADNGERWLRLYVAEADNDPTACAALSVRIRLYPAAGTDYDLYVYCDNCTSSQQSSTNTGSTMDEVIMAWDEACNMGFPTGTESGRYVYIQVQYWSANICDDWYLTATGHTGGANTCPDK
ncbi:MAG: MopE-related protein [bacterium]